MYTQIDKLKNSPLLAMSLGSKELFHSNFWAWLFTRDDGCRYAQLFFPEIISTPKVEREQGNRDLTLWVDNNTKAFVIENKIKSSPTKKQLDGYEEVLNKHKLFAGGVITGIVEPSFIAQCPHWKFISYNSIGKAILSIAGDKPGFDNDLIREYAEMIITLSSSILDFTGSYTNSLVRWQECEEMESIRMGDICKKINADMFVQYLNQTLKPELERIMPDEFELEITSGFTNKSSLIDIRYTSRSHREFMIGIQIQGSQYRKCAERRTTTNCDKVFNEFKLAGWFTDFDPKQKPKEIMGHDTSLGKEFDQYIGTAEKMTYYFVYQYWNITDYSFEHLKEQILSDMKDATTIASSIRIV